MFLFIHFVHTFNSIARKLIINSFDLNAFVFVIFSGIEVLDNDGQCQTLHNQGEENGNAVTIEKQEQGWKVTAPLNVDLTEEAINPLLTLLSNFKAIDVQMGLKDEEVGFTTPRKTIMVTTNDATYSLRVGNQVTSSDQETASYYLRLDGDPRVLVISEEAMKTLPSRIADLENTPKPTK